MGLLLLYRLGLSSGWLRLSTPSYSWSDRPFEAWVHSHIAMDAASYAAYRNRIERSFLFDRSVNLSTELKAILGEDSLHLLAEADEIIDGRFRLFGGPMAAMGSAPDWDRFPELSGVSHAAAVDLSCHWSAYSLDAFAHDIKLLWEPSRFAWVFSLGRAFCLSQDERYVEGFWSLLESWRAANLPNTGPQWISGQEAALRLMALVFGFYAFFPELQRRPQRLLTLAEMIANHAARIPPTMVYARAQGNNHLLSEAVALYTTGLLFPEFRQAKRWHRLGRRYIQRAIHRQVFADGGYVQHSLNYQRLALQTTLWAVRLAELNGEPFPPQMNRSLQSTTDCLQALVDPMTGSAPNFGPNDGALILPISTCAFRDYRPTIQLAHQVLGENGPYPPGPWDEACFWFGFVKAQMRALHSRERAKNESQAKGSQKPDHKQSAMEGHDEGPARNPAKKDFPQAGLYLMRHGQAWGMLRCAQFRTRPGDSDQLHLDLWWRGCNIARDAGTYLYHGQAPWDNALSLARVHNTLLMDDLDPMWRAGRFLWLRWAQGRFLGRWSSANGLVEMIAAEHIGYRRWGVSARRTVIRAGEQHWLVADELLGEGTHVLRTGWLVLDGSWQEMERGFRVNTPAGEAYLEMMAEQGMPSLYRAGELLDGEALPEPCATLGWYSPTYAHKEPALFIAAKSAGQLPLRLISRWQFGEADPGEVVVTWKTPGSSPTSLNSVVYRGEELDF